MKETGTGRGLVKIDEYERYVGAEAVERIGEKARRLAGMHVVNMNSTYYGGGVAELLGSLTLLLNSLGVKTGWRVIQGSPDFFSITKKMHNALQGGEINLTERKKKIYEAVVYENAVRNHLDHDVVIVHDPQPLPMIEHYRRRGPWVWRCHVDLTSPDLGLIDYLGGFIRKYDATLFTMKEYCRGLGPPELFFRPAIDPFSIKNRELTEGEIDERLDHYGIPTDLPLVVQVSRFDKWKDPAGVIEAFRIARKEVDATLVLLGNVATDDPEGKDVYESLLDCEEERIIILSHQDTALVNALQTRAAVAVQKSIREGFGLTVAEAMWKGTPVVGGNAGGIRCQIDDGENGFLVNNVEECAERIVRLVKDPDLRREMGGKGREKVRENFLLTRLAEQYLDMFGSFVTSFTIDPSKVRQAGDGGCT